MTPWPARPIGRGIDKTLHLPALPPAPVQVQAPHVGVVLVLADLVSVDALVLHPVLAVLLLALLDHLVAVLALVSIGASSWFLVV